MKAAVARTLYWTAAWAGRPVHGLRPRKIYHRLAEAGFTKPQFRWHRNRYGQRMRLSPYYWIDRDIIPLGCYDPAQHRALANLVTPGMTVLDIGANIGDVALHLAHLAGPTGQVHAFEPVPDVYRRLQEHVDANNLGDRVHTHTVALSDQNGTMTFAAADLHGRNQGQGSLVNQERETAAVELEVPTRTLDGMVDELGIDRLDLIKLDIQGGETFMLRGGEATIRRFRPVLVMEVEPEDLACLGRDSRDLVRQVTELGYRVCRHEKGRPGAALDPETLAPDFRASHVICLPNHP